MSEPETFFSRWLRLKSESETVAVPPADASPVPAFDPSGLPPIESIGADSDVRLFLQAGVPEELTRAALRSVWTADQSIRDFVGIAESQWDFNDPAAIPGFGSLAADDCALAARFLGTLKNAPDPAACESAQDTEQSASELSDRSQEADLESGIAESTDTEPVTQSVPAEAPPDPPARRSHGGALPK